ncbi:NIPSNAP family protein [Pseudoxanthomonas wuyuanensis]
MTQAIPASPIVELRQYTLHPGRREDLIELFERELLQPQAAAGMQVIGQFRDLDRPDRFVWLRGFADMEMRRKALGDFYGGPIWKRYRTEANATMIDSDDVLLLHPAEAETAFELPDAAPSVDPAAAPALVVAALHYFDAAVSPRFLAYFHQQRQPLLAAMGATALGSFVSDYSENTFPALPLREGEHVFIWFAAFQGDTEWQRCKPLLQAWPIIDADPLPPPRTTEILRLQPTAHSRLGWLSA